MLVIKFPALKANVTTCIMFLLFRWYWDNNAKVKGSMTREHVKMALDKVKMNRNIQYGLN